ncbi:amino acid permease-domain-containing protein [Aspergillus karnatakaensis]|uniref:amino acid permease-domain-containing protein n=1 Tax=Aspergillus karnatakaensis TaxID=1810916 RepID=UPI003CCCC213
MVTFMPVPSAVITFASKWVDEALGFAMGWNYFLNMSVDLKLQRILTLTRCLRRALLVPFEIVALSLMIGYWTDVMPAAAVVVIMMVIYLILNVISVSWFGAAEFYIGIFKVLLALGLTFYTFITMVGGNPQHDTYGFRYWNHPGAFAEHLVSGPSGGFCGVVAAMVQAGFTICGPEYLSMVAAETKNPRAVIRRAYKTFLVRVLLFFIGGALCIGIVIPYDDATLAHLLGEGVSTGAASPYVISMQRLGIAGLGSVVNAGIMISLVSAGNALLFSATRTLYGMAVDGKAPRVLAYVTRNGIPIRALFVSLSVCLLGLLQVSESSAKVMNYLITLITANQLLNHFSVSLTYIHFYRALRAQGIDRNTLPYKGRFQPYTSYIAVTSTALLTLLLGFDLFVDMPNNWSVRYFFLDYAMLAFYVVMFVGWKVVKKTRYMKPTEVDLGLGGARSEIEAHEKLVEDAEPVGSINYQGTRTRCLLTVHEKYGGAVRIGPTEVSFNTLSALRTIYGAGTVFQRDSKRLLNHAYSKTSILSPRNARMVEEKVQQFMALIEREADKSGCLEIFASLHYFSLDTITRFLYGRGTQGATGALTSTRHRALLNDILDPARRRLSWFTVHFPTLTNWMYSRTGILEDILVSLNLLPMSKPATYSEIRAHALDAVEQTHQSVSSPGTDPVDTAAVANESIAERLLTATRSETHKGGGGGSTSMDHLDVAAECADHLLAGIDTTSDTLMWAIFALSQAENHPFQEKLRAEIRSLSLDDDNNNNNNNSDNSDNKIINALIADKLPYLDAVLKETLRLFAPLPGTEPRVADTDQVIDGYRIPRGTVVSISPYTLHRNSAVFADPLRFNPDRWMTGSVEELAAMKRGFWAFSSGGRMCIGMQ